MNATEDFLKSELIAKDVQIAQLLTSLNDSQKLNTSYRITLGNLKDAMQTWTSNAIEERLISESEAEEIAEICGFDLTKEVEVEVTVTYNLTVNVPLGNDVESIVSDIDFDTVSYNDEHISYLTSNVDNVDF